MEILGLEKYNFLKVNEKGFEEFIIFDVERAKKEINGILEVNVTLKISYLVGLIQEANKKVILFKLKGNPC